MIKTKFRRRYLPLDGDYDKGVIVDLEIRSEVYSKVYGAVPLVPINDEGQLDTSIDTHEPYRDFIRAITTGMYGMLQSIVSLCGWAQENIPTYPNRTKEDGTVYISVSTRERIRGGKVSDLEIMFQNMGIVFSPEEALIELKAIDAKELTNKMRALQKAQAAELEESDGELVEYMKAAFENKP